MTFILLSPAFADRAPIPVLHTCDGENSAPPLGWSGAPPGTMSFALIVDDPDAPDPAAPKRTFVHWVAYDIPPAVSEIAAGGELPAGSRAGGNDRGEAAYTGPCPPIGRHRYFFKIYALDATLGDLGDRPTKADLERAMQGHVLEHAEIVGTYQRDGA